VSIPSQVPSNSSRCKENARPTITTERFITSVKSSTDTGAYNFVLGKSSWLIPLRRSGRATPVKFMFERRGYITTIPGENLCAVERVEQENVLEELVSRALDDGATDFDEVCEKEGGFPNIHVRFCLLSRFGMISSSCILVRLRTRRYIQSGTILGKQEPWLENHND